MIPGGVEVNQLAQIRLIFKVKFGNDPLSCNQIKYYWKNYLQISNEW